jgi:hypothetical protein
MRGCVATFDRGIRLSAVRGARPAHLSVVGPADRPPEALTSILPEE